MQRAAIEHAAQLAGLELASETDVSIEGDDPVLATPFHLGEGAATALALVGQEAALVWEERGGRKQSLSIDVRHAAASLVSYSLLRVEDMAGRELARDDDSAGDLNARIAGLRPEKDGIYRIVATSTVLAAGRFTLRIQQQELPAKAPIH